MGSLSFALKPAFTKISYKQAHNLDAIIYFKAPAVDAVKRTPLHLIASVDVSGSMGGEKIEMVKRSLAKLVEHLTEEDYFGIVAFTTDVQTICRPAFMTTENKNTFQQAIAKLTAQSMTNFSGGLVQALRLLNDDPLDKQCIRRVIMFTDGHPTCGVRDIEGITRLGKEHLGMGSVTCFGYGSDHDPELLNTLSAQANGNFYYGETPDKIMESFAAELGGLITSAAQLLKFRLLPSQGVKINEIYNDMTVSEDDGKIVAEIGDVLAESEVAVAFSLKVDARNKAFPRATTILRCEVEYLDLATSKTITEDLQLRVEFVKPEDVDTKIDPEVDKHVMLQKSVQVELRARHLADQGDYKGANIAMLNFVAESALAGHQELSEDIARSAVNYSSSACYLGGGRHSNVARVRAKSLGRGTGQLVYGSSYTSAQSDMASSWTSTPDPAPANPSLSDDAVEAILDSVSELRDDGKEASSYIKSRKGW